ncbi:MAG TPA: two-component regulator propeller domain-containing protein [Terriglobia bacterium]|jgi:ligand-binding sensor domain-containing protein/signal transduction histidine kinase
MLRPKCLSLAGVLLLLFLCIPAFALDPNRALTQYVHRIWQAPQGLPDATITSILQTHDGYLWLGTEAGLVRFDGVRFSEMASTSPAAQPPLKGAWVRNILEDKHHNLWVGTNEAGLIRLENGVATQYLQKDEPQRSTVQCLLQDRNENIWACTSTGLARLNQGKLTMYGMPQGLPSNNVRSACEAPDGTLWVGGDGNRLSSWNGSSFINHPLTSMPEYGDIRALLCSDDGAVWAGTTNGLIRFAGGREHLMTVKDGLPDNWIYSLIEGRDGTLWIGTKSGFSRFRNGKFESYRTEDGLSQSTVYSLYEDREGSLWAGTKHGLNQFLEGRTIPYTVSEGLPTNDVGPVLQDRDGTVWVGTIGAGLCRFDDARHLTVLTTKQGLAGNEIYALAEDPAGDLWVGTNAGLNLLRHGSVVETYTRDQGLADNHIRFLFHDHAGALWIGTPSGLSMFVNGRFIQPKDASRLSAVAGGEDKAGHFLAATEAGLKIYQDHAFREFAPSDIPLREVDTFFVDQEGLLWMGTLGAGLRLLKDGKVSSYFMRDGLFDNEIYGIAEDSQDRLWMASSKGIFSVNRSDLRKFAEGEIQKFVSTPYSPLDGLRTIESRSGVQPAVWKMKDGTLWFATIRGLLVLDPAKLQRNAPAPPVVIEDVIVNSRKEAPAAIGSAPAGRKDLEFRYTALSFLAPAGIRFRYKLEGYDTNWTDASTRRDAYYTNLPPGKFQFRVIACNVDGLCNESGSAVAFSLAPYYYQRAWFFPLCGAGLLFVAWLVWHMRVRSLRQQFEIVLAERGRIARELHDTLLQGFSGITMGMQAISTGLSAGQGQSRLNELIRDAAQCMREARQSIAGLRAVKGGDAELQAAIAETARQITKSKDIQLKLKLDRGPSHLPASVEGHLLRIAQEAIANSTRHADATTIEVGLRFAKNSICLTVQDDGKGLADAAGPAAGHYGLTGMRERASQIGAQFELLTGPVQGTTVRVLVPAP